MYEGLGFAPPVRNDAGFRALQTINFPNANESVVDYIVNKLCPPSLNGKFGYTEQIGRTAIFNTESHFACAAHALAKAAPKSYGNVFNIFPAPHVADASYMFYDASTNSSMDTTTALIMQDYLINFILTGAPSSNIAGLALYPAYSENASVIQINPRNFTVVRESAANTRCEWRNQALCN